MYVKSLTLKGFKSFADPVTLDLQPGVNVVVGPNGSGKSNVIDAVAWVLGAQGARALRGGKMDDVIFAGAGKRSALGRAEVSLSIDNSDGRIPVEFSEVTITRTLFRTGESEYAINGVSCRLLDIQELLSDSGVGRQQHVIVSQGNLDAVLSARPEDRRAIVEEAAGVLKYRKRRERSQRRLEGTESNLERLQDLVREVRQQLRPLQKQAEAARRHVEVAGELRQLKLHVAGRDIEALRHRENNAAAESALFEEQEAELRTQLVAAETEVEKAEAALSEFADDDLGEQVERLERLFQRVKGLSALMAERRRSLQRDLASSVSQDVVAQLESDAANVGRELEDVETERGSLVEPHDELVVRESHLATAWLEFEAEWGEGLPVASNEAAQIRGELSSLKKNADALSQERHRRSGRSTHVEAQLAQLRTEAEQAEAQLSQAHQLQAGLSTAVLECESQQEQVGTAHEEALSNLRDAEQRASVAQARLEALNSALDASRAKAGVERLAEIEGIVGTLADLVAVDDGYQAAFEAAAGEAMAAVVVQSLSSAQSALDHLRSGDTDGAVLVLGQPYGDRGHAPKDEAGITELRGKVRSGSVDSQNGPAVEELLDRVLCCSVVVDGGWREAIDFSMRFPDLIVVTKQGDRFSRGGWRIGTGGAGATSAAVDEAAREEGIARATIADLSARVQSTKAQKDKAAAAERDARKAVLENDRQIQQATQALDRSNSRSEALKSELENVAGSLAHLDERLAAEQERVEQLELRLPSLEAAEASGAERARLWREARGVLEQRSTDLRAERSRLDLRGKALDERAQFLTRRRESLNNRLEQHKVEVARAAERRQRLEHSIAVLERLSAMVQARTGQIETLLDDVRDQRNADREQRREITDQLSLARRDKSTAESALLESGERKQQHLVRIAEVRMRLEAVIEVLTTELEVDPQTAIDTPQPDLPEGKTAKQRIADLDRELRQMGPINPLALEEFVAVQERHEFLDKQLQDVQESRRELVRVIRAVDAEIQETFKSAYEDVSRNFTHLFGVLFPGGEGNLRLTDPENPLETGIEIEAKPSGKNVRTLSLLSGGERSLAAMAFLFAVFRSRPSPFYLLDEVEAPLDDMNLTRFLSLIGEFRNEAQLVMVSHQKRTMEVADCLYGVTMQAGGSSKVVSQKVGMVDITEQPAI